MSRDFASTLKENKRRNSADAISRRDAGQKFGVDFDDHPTASAISSNFRQFGRYHLARAAPCRPEIDQDRDRRLLRDRIEGCFAVGLKRFIRRPQFILAFAAAKAFVKP